MKFDIQQIAIAPANTERAIELLIALGAGEWARDHVVANGQVHGKKARNEANLAFNYELVPGKEFEVLTYTAGENWLDANMDGNCVSHLGMHCTEAELAEFRAFFEQRGIAVAQEVFTESHTNPVIAGQRWYHYTIFATREILGVDLKFIVRLEKPCAP